MSKEKEHIVDIKDILKEKISEDDEGDKLLKVNPNKLGGQILQTSKQYMDLTPPLSSINQQMRHSVASTMSIKPRIS
jgi:hypothetical protein